MRMREMNTHTTLAATILRSVSRCSSVLTENIDIVLYPFRKIGGAIL